MKYSDVVNQCIISVINGNVAYVEGHAGIGKSALAREISEKIKTVADISNVKVFTLFGSLLKEGELGGMPVPYKDAETKKMINTYTTHIVLQDIINFCNEDDGNLAILFIDELNRCDHAVQQELMQLILEFRINETYLPENCSIIAAGNPDGFDYQVLEMNDALMDRLALYELETDTKEWLAWATRDMGENSIHQDIVEFIAEFPYMLHDPKAVDRVKPTPRSWEKLSKDYKVINEYFTENREDLLMSSARAIVGPNAAAALINFIRNKDNPLVKATEIFESKGEIFEKVCERIKGDTATRQFVVIGRAVKYLNENIKNINSKIIERFIRVLDVLPKDSMVGVIRDIGSNHKELHKIFGSNNEYQNLFFECNKRARESAKL